MDTLQKIIPEVLKFIKIRPQRARVILNVARIKKLYGVPIVHLDNLTIEMALFRYAAESGMKLPPIEGIPSDTPAFEMLPEIKPVNRMVEPEPKQEVEVETLIETTVKSKSRRKKS